MSESKYAPGVLLPPPAELQLGADAPSRFDYPSGYGQRVGLTGSAFPEPIAVDAPETLRTAKMFGCSGGLDSRAYREATKFRTMPEMGWEEARVAFNRLYEPARHNKTTSQYVALAEFALTAIGFTSFVGRRGEHAVKLRDALVGAGRMLHRHLRAVLQAAANNAAQLAGPITAHGGITRLGSGAAAAEAIWRAFMTLQPMSAEEWVTVVEATPDQAMAALEYLRATMVTWEARRPLSCDIRDRLLAWLDETSENPPTAAEYTEAIHIAEMLSFTSAKLLTLYAGIMHSMPIYRLYPATSEPEAIALWWPWGRPPPLVDGRPPRPPVPAKRVLDPSIITATRPQDIVREVMQKTGINRTTAQSMTAALRQKMRSDRQQRARALLAEGLTKAEVARRVGLSPSRISALFTGERFARPRAAWRRANSTRRANM